MTALTHDNISLQFDSGIAFMTVNGPIKSEALDKTLDWLSDIDDNHDEFDMCVDMAKMGFDSLGAVDKAFRDIGHVLRMTPSINKCAVLTDSLFVQSKAKVEGAVLPGTEVESFDIEALDPAVRWLKAGEEVALPEDILSTNTSDTKSNDKMDLAAMFGQ